jgi:DEAD/DEAH box helicase domain-containing protein
MPLTTLLARWQADPDTGPNFAAWRTTPLRPAELQSLPADLPSGLESMLHAQGIFDLYSHQADAWAHARAAENVALATGTASGKTLAYNLPVYASLLQEPQARALYIFPTKALAQDQLSVISHQLSVLGRDLAAGIYDGDTPQSQRGPIRKQARLVLTNPDMLHTGILPHHTNWMQFFAGLRFVVIDEMHTYRGVFGSHVANVLRRLRRIARFYGSEPQFMLASATIGNAQELAERLIEAPVRLIDRDGSARGPRHFMIYNPPVTDPALGLRKSAILESVRLSQDLMAQDVQTVVFARARRTVEMVLTYLQAPSPLRASPKLDLEGLGSKASPGVEFGGGGRRRFPAGEGPEGVVRGYRSGYLPSQRREIEKGLRDGSVKTVVATNALELGIDIGGLGAAVLIGYPGTVASARQQAGRAGRGLEPAAAVLVASPNPLDQFLAHHPDYLFDRSPESALVNPNHLLILLNHLRCAIFELPFQKGEGFGGLAPETVNEYLEFLIANQEAHASEDKFFWMADSYPAAGISLRSASPESFTLQVEADRPQTVGVVDGESALWMVHPGAIYLHEAQQFFVEELNLEERIARLLPIASDYYTEPLRETSVQVLSVLDQVTTGERGSKAYGEIQVTTQVTGFRKLRWYTHENLGQEPLDLPPSDLQTTAYWLELSDKVIETLRAAGAWTNDPNDYGPDWPRIRDTVRRRDGYRCQVCGTPESGARQHDVHHKIPFRSFASPLDANRLENLITVCPSCHRKVEQNVRIRSGLAGLATALASLAPLFLMCDPADIGTHIEPVPSEAFAQPSVLLYDLVPAGIGFSQKLFELHDELLRRALELVEECPCTDGCPSCVGPGGENGTGGKAETLALLRELAAE